MQAICIYVHNHVIVIVNLFSSMLHFMVNHWWYPGGINMRTLSKNLGARNDKPRFVTSPFARIVQTRQPQLASDSFFGVKLDTLSKSFGAQNDNFFNMRSSILGN